MKIQLYLYLLFSFYPSATYAIPFNQLPAYNCTYFLSAQLKEKIDVSFLGQKAELLLIRKLGPEPDHYFALTQVNSGNHLYSQFGIRSGSSNPLQLAIEKKSTVLVTYLLGRTAIRWTDSGQEFEIECLH